MFMNLCRIGHIPLADKQWAFLSCDFEQGYQSFKEGIHNQEKKAFPIIYIYLPEWKKQNQKKNKKKK